MTPCIRIGVPADTDVADDVVPRIALLAPDLFVEAVAMHVSDDPMAPVPDGALDRAFEDALHDGDIDAFVGPAERMPVLQDGRVQQAAVLQRMDPGYTISPMPLDDLPSGSTVSVCSPLMECMVNEARPDLDASMVHHDACARVSPAYIRSDGQALDAGFFIPSPGQGALAAMCRRDDGDMRSILYRLNHMPTRVSVNVEMAVMKLMGAVNIAPVGVHACMEGDAIHVRAVSYGYTSEPRRADAYLPLDYVMDEVLGISEYLVGKRDYIL